MFGCLSAQRYRIFFFLEKFIFWHFWGKIEWVSKKLYFFFRGCIFFFRPLKTSEWVGSKLFLGKKKYTFLLGKKNTPQKCKNTFLPRGAAAQPSEWLSNYSWEKKIHLYFFSSRNAEKKIHDFPKTSEWVALNFSREKKIRYLCIGWRSKSYSKCPLFFRRKVAQGCGDLAWNRR